MSTVFIQKRIGKKGLTYAVRYADPLTGSKKHYQTFNKYKLAQQTANDLRALLDSGKIPDKRGTKFTPISFEQVAESLKEKWTSAYSRNELSPKTYLEYCTWLNVLNRTFGKTLLCQITKDEILAFRDGEALKNSNVSANKYLTILKRVFSQGLELRAVISDPSQGIKGLSEKQHQRDRFIYPHEIINLVKASSQFRAKFYLPAMIYLGAEHGASRQEVLSLKWSDIDFEFAGRGLITLFRSKTGKKRTEYLMPRTKKALLSWQEHQAWMRHRKKFSANGNLVFCHLDGTPIKRFDKAWSKACKLAGLEDLHFHDLRHTFCSNLILSGASLKEVKEMIGHADISMTDRYSHLSTEYKLLWQNRLADYYSRKPLPEP